MPYTVLEEEPSVGKKGYKVIQEPVGIPQIESSLAPVLTMPNQIRQSFGGSPTLDTQRSPFLPQGAEPLSPFLGPIELPGPRNFQEDVASLGETLGETLEAGSKPLVNFPPVPLKAPFFASQEGMDVFNRRLSEGLSGATSPFGLGTLGAMAIPYVGPALMTLLGTKAVSSGLGEASVGGAENVGGGLADILLGLPMAGYGLGRGIKQVRGAQRLADLAEQARFESAKPVVPSQRNLLTEYADPIPPLRMAEPTPVMPRGPFRVEQKYPGPEVGKQVERELTERPFDKVKMAPIEPIVPRGPFRPPEQLHGISEQTGIVERELGPSTELLEKSNLEFKPANFPGIGKLWQFTYKGSGPAEGATFYTKDTASSEEIQNRLQEKITEFEKGAQNAKTIRGDQGSILPHEEQKRKTEIQQEGVEKLGSSDIQQSTSGEGEPGASGVSPVGPEVPGLGVAKAQKKAAKKGKKAGTGADWLLQGIKAVVEKTGFGRGVKIAGQQIFNRLRNLASKGEIQPSELESFEKAGLKEFLSGPRTTEEVAKWMGEKGEKVEVRKFGETHTKLDPNYEKVRERNQLQHEVIDIMPRASRDKIDEIFDPIFGTEDPKAELSKWIGNPEQVDKIIRWAQLQKELQGIQVSDLRNEGQAHWQSIAPKSEQDMPGYVEIAVVKPLRKFSREERIQQFQERYKRQIGRELTPREIELSPEFSKAFTSEEEAVKFPSSHTFPPNTLGFVRGYMETTKDGKKVFHVIEVQSDWAQQRRQQQEQIRERREQGLQTRGERDLADPLLPHWERLAVKAAIDHAREQGADAIAFSDAETAMMTEGHDRVGYPNVGGPPYYNNEAAAQAALTRLQPRYDFPLRVVHEGDSWNVQGRGKDNPITQEPGMRLHYDTILPKIAEELTGQKGEKVSLGEHKNAFEEVGASALEPGLGYEEPRKNLIFRNPDGTPKTDVSGLMFKLPERTEPFSIFGKDVFKKPESQGGGLRVKEAMEKGKVRRKETGAIFPSGKEGRKPAVPGITQLGDATSPGTSKPIMDFGAEYSKRLVVEYKRWLREVKGLSEEQVAKLLTQFYLPPTGEFKEVVRGLGTSEAMQRGRERRGETGAIFPSGKEGRRPGVPGITQGVAGIEGVTEPYSKPIMDIHSGITKRNIVDYVTWLKRVKGYTHGQATKQVESLFGDPEMGFFRKFAEEKPLKGGESGSINLSILQDIIERIGLIKPRHPTPVKDRPFLSDMMPKTEANEQFAKKFGIDRIPIFGRLAGGKARFKNETHEALGTWYVERHGVSRAKASALGLEIKDKINSAFKPNADGDLNVGAGVGQSQKASDVFGALRRNPEAYRLTGEQRKVFKAIIEPILNQRESLIRRYGLVDSDLLEDSAYFPRIVTKMPKEKKGLPGGARVGSKKGFQRERAFVGSEKEGWDEGYRYETDLEKILVQSTESLYKAIADKRLQQDPLMRGRTFQQLKNDLLEFYAEDIGAGRKSEATVERMAKGVQARGIVQQPAFFGRILDEETAKFLNNEFAAELANQKTWTRGMAKLNSQIKALTLGFDLGVGQIQLLPTLFSNPRIWAKAQVMGMGAVATDKFFTNYAQKNIELIKELAEYGASTGRLEEYLSGLEKGKGISGVMREAGAAVEEKLGKAAGHVVKSPAYVTEAFSRNFQTVLDVAKVELWKARRNWVPQSEWPELAQSIETQLLSGRMESGAVTRSRAFKERVLLLAPAYYRGAVNLIADMGMGAARAARGKRPGVSGANAMKTMTAFMAGSVALYYGVAKMLDMSDEEIEERMDPRRSDFMLWKVEEGEQNVNVGFGGIFRSVIRLFGNMVKTSVEHPENWRSLSSDKNPLTRWYRGHAGPVPGMLWDLTGRDFFNRESDLTDVPARIAPLPLQEYIRSRSTPVTMTESVGKFAGATVFPETMSKFRLLNEHAEEKFGKSYGELSLNERRSLVRSLDKTTPLKTKDEKRLAMERGFEATLERQENILDRMKDDTVKFLSDRSLTVPGYRPVLSLEEVSVPLTEEEGTRYEELLAKNYDEFIRRTVMRGSKTFDRMPLERREDELRKILTQAKKRASSELQAEITRKHKSQPMRK